MLSQTPYDWLAVNPEAWIANALHIGNLWQCRARMNGGLFDQGGLIVCWSLSIEEQFYLVWPLVVALTSRRWLTGHERLTLTGHVDRLLQLEFTSGGHILISISRDGSVKRWRADERPAPGRDYAPPSFMPKMVFPGPPRPKKP